ncbi:hypothetical protein GGS21DRAFT_519449 [Xylaria nigripes]|nr:hypothetical protein GGS21DRAFT_519449 [Xylaria nigripes]
MQFSAILVAAIFTLGIAAKKHRHCQCYINGRFDEGLSHDVCNNWGTQHPNSEWDSSVNACKGTNPNGGIDGRPWNDLCEAIWYGRTGQTGGTGHCF